MNVRLADPRRSRIVLIGTPFFRHADARLPDVPVVANNLADFAAVLTDPELGGFAPEHCVIAPPDVRLEELGGLMADAAEQASDLLLIYFAGHGVTGPRGELYLTLAGTRWERLIVSALSYETIRLVCLDSRARSRVVIIDSCFSGRAIGTPLGATEHSLADELQVEGTYTLTSAHANSTALILPGEKHTAFTGRLLDLLSQGIPTAGPFLGLGEIFKELRIRLNKAALPEPQQRLTETGDLLGLVRNRGYSAPSPGDSTSEWKALLGNKSERVRLAGIEELGDWLRDVDPVRRSAAQKSLQDFVTDAAGSRSAGRDIRAARRLLGYNEVVARAPSSPAVIQLFLVLECSRSMRTDGRMSALNFAVRELLPGLISVMNQRYPHYSLCLRTIAFSGSASWTTSVPTPVESYVHADLKASDTTADLGAALHLLAKELEIPPLSPRSLAPVVVLATGSAPVDGWRSGLRALNNSAFGPRAQRLAVALGEQADPDVLTEFASVPGMASLAPGRLHTLAQDCVDAIVRALEFDDVW